MSDYREESEKAKLAKRGIVEQRPVSSNKKKKHKYKLVGDWMWFKLRENVTIGKYATLDAVEKAKAAAIKSAIYINVKIEEL